MGRGGWGEGSGRVRVVASPVSGSGQRVAVTKAVNVLTRTRCCGVVMITHFRCNMRIYVYIYTYIYMHICICNSYRNE